MRLTVFAMLGPVVLDVAIVNEKVASSRIEQRRDEKRLLYREGAGRGEFVSS